MSGASSPVSGVDGEPKRKKIRKGTTSCWECKRRKTRCQFRSPSDEICIGCQRRETACLSQEYPEHPPQGASRSIVRIEERLERLETLLERVVDNAISSPKTRRRRDSYLSQSQTADYDVTDYNILTPNSVNTPHPDTAPLLYSAVINDSTTAVSIPTPETTQTTSSSGRSNFKAINRKLYELFPSQRDADLIIGTGATASFLQFFTLSHSEIFSGNARPASMLSALPSSSSHPVLLVRTLLYLAIGIQQLHPSTFDVKQLNLGKTPWEAKTQYLDAASEFIAGNDRHLDSLEALECFMLEGYYHMNTGNLRRAWLLFRRAIGLGQLMGLHRGSTRAVKELDPQGKANAPFMWYRAVYADRFIALLLGLPASTAQNSIFASEEILKTETPIGRLERVHCVISGRIIERNENTADDGFATTLSIDSSLQRAAKSMPAKWWLLSSASEEAAAEKLDDLMRIIAQMVHFNLLILLHLPYMIRVSPERRFDYSKIACINNSRELLTRFARLRSFLQVTFCSRSIDFWAFTGCLTLLLAHIDSHRSNNGMDDFLAHQRDSDRAMVEEAINLLLLDNRPNNDALAQQTAAILKCLLAIEADASSDVTSTDAHAEKTDRGLRLTIPYFGCVNISRNGIAKSIEDGSSLDFSSCTAVDIATNSPRDLPLAHDQSAAFLKGQDFFISPHTTPAESENQQTSYQQPDLEQVPWETIPNAPSINLQTDFFPNIQHYPVGLNAEVQDWALQGVDRTLFENLLRGDGLYNDSTMSH